MSEVGGARSTSPRSDHAMVLDVSLLHETRIVEDDPGPTQVMEPAGKKQKACDANKELADDVPEKAVLKMMQRMQAENDRREENLFSRLQVSLKSAAEDAVGRLSGELYHNLKNWEARMEDKMHTHLNDHRSDFEKKWENKIEQLEPGSKGWCHLAGRISHSDRGAKKLWTRTGRIGWRMRTRSQTVKSSRCIIWSIGWNKK